MLALLSAFLALALIFLFDGIVGTELIGLTALHIWLAEVLSKKATENNDILLTGEPGEERVSSLVERRGF